MHAKPKDIPKHVAIIMDGNRRWARKKKMPAVFGHNHVIDNTLEPLVDKAILLEISHLTFWAWSTENWKRSKMEITAIMRLFRNLFEKRIERLHKKGVKIQTIGDITKFPKDIQKKIKEAVEKTKNNTNITVVFAINYGGHDELLRTVNKLNKNTKYTLTDIEKHLDTAEMPRVDLIIRPGGEKRLSGFLLWQSAYAELYFVDILMPEFNPAELQKAVEDFKKRQRRFGK